MKRSLLLASLFILFLILLSYYLSRNLLPEIYSLNHLLTPSVSPIPAKQLYKVTRVIDGDTIEIEGGQKVRYIGMNTPETVDPRKPVKCFGQEAKVKNKELVEGKNVRLEKDVSETDKYGRLLRYVYVGDIFVNLELVKQGFAQIMTYPPDISHAQDFITAQREARQNNLGLWNKCY